VTFQPLLSCTQGLASRTVITLAINPFSITHHTLGCTQRKEVQLITYINSYNQTDCKIVARTVLIYSSQVWTICKREESRITASGKWNEVHEANNSISRFPFQRLHYQSKGKRSLERPIREWNEPLGLMMMMTVKVKVLIRAYDRVECDAMMNDWWFQTSYEVRKVGYHITERAAVDRSYPWYYIHPDKKMAAHSYIAYRCWY
jgi:hypothetical protein